MQYRSPQKHKIWPIVGIVLLLLASFFAYDRLVARNVRAADSNLVSSADQVEPKSPFNPEQMAMLGRIEGLKIDGSIFQDQSFKSLKDLTVELAPQPVGRPNPFAPLGAPAKTTVKR